MGGPQLQLQERLQRLPVLLVLICFRISSRVCVLLFACVRSCHVRRGDKFSGDGHDDVDVFTAVFLPA